jgi:integrase
MAETKSQTLKPNTVARYRDYINNDLIPAFGAVRVERRTHRHVQQFVDRELAAGRGPVTLRRCISTLSSAVNDAVRHRRLSDNAARFTDIPQPSRTEMTCWSTAQTIAFLRFCRTVASPLTELYELMICTGMRKGEVLGLHWSDVALDEQMLFVRHTLVSVNNARLMFNDPKSRGSRAWVALSPRAIDVPQRQRDRQRRQRSGSTRYDDLDLVFCRPDGQPLRPDYVLRHFRSLVADAGLPSMRVPDLPTQPSKGVYAVASACNWGTLRRGRTASRASAPITANGHSPRRIGCFWQRWRRRQRPTMVRTAKASADSGSTPSAPFD